MRRRAIGILLGASALPLAVALSGCRALVVKDAGAAAAAGVQQGAKAIDTPEVRADVDDAARSLFEAVRDDATSPASVRAYQGVIAALGATTREQLDQLIAELLSPAHRAALLQLARDLVDELIAGSTSPASTAKLAALVRALAPAFADVTAGAFSGAQGQVPPLVTEAIAPVRAALDAEITRLEHWIEGLGAAVATLLVGLVLLTHRHQALRKQVAAGRAP